MKEYNTHRRLRTGRLQSVGICLMPTSATVRRGLFVRPMLRGGEDLQAVRIAFRVDSTSSGFLEGVPQLWKVGSFLQLMWSRRLPVFGKEQRVKACGFLRGLFVLQKLLGWRISRRNLLVSNFVLCAGCTT